MSDAVTSTAASTPTAAETQRPPVFPILVETAAGTVLIHFVSFCIDAFVPHGRELLVLAGKPGPFRPERVTVPSADDGAALAWLCGPAGIARADAEKILDLAKRMEMRFMTRGQEVTARRCKDGAG